MSLPTESFQKVVDAYAVRHGADPEQSKTQASRKRFVETHLAGRLVNEARDHLQNEAAEKARLAVPELPL